MKQLFLLFTLLAASRASAISNPVRIACIGDSVMHGNGLPSRERNNFPAQLQNMLGSRYEVKMYTLPYRPQQITRTVILCFADTRQYEIALSPLLMTHRPPRVIFALPPALPGTDLAARSQQMETVRALALKHPAKSLTSRR